jgi:hypothetical protein
MAGALTHQPLPLTMEPARILFLGRRRPNYAAALRIALHKSHNRPEQTLSINIVRFYVLGTPIDGKTRAIEDVVLDAVVDKHAVQPEAVVARLIAAHCPKVTRALVAKLRLQAIDKLKQPRFVTARYRMHTDLLANRGEKVATSQVARLNSIAKKSVSLKPVPPAFMAGSARQFICISYVSESEKLI